ncbi:carboxypeptidase-like regulatory domain-containing protein [Hymenobacter rubripertinctus]|uniref:Carboxypeptidase-like regulatory domain-containing protein n=1 Tax=Hymenobacter rubripertinctus TaxID=2029981 RepID=A0A418R6J5_9BACT|nr:carboxypeptidase-like regulatory domain-containing protein [Hymenobacter rubripertinctus]RIY12945.1 carboxypeptidase-like regulatory domain-containing protein [Hymenobacter rubripertinctus]
MRLLRFSISLFMLLTVLGATARAQVISGVITKAGTQEPVPFVNIGVPGKAVGTVSDERGYYRLHGVAPTDTVRVSSMGFRPRRLTGQVLQAQPNVLLTEDAVALRGVTVKAKGLFRRTRTLGVANESNGTITLLASDLGAEIGTVISLKHKPTKVLNANFNVAYNRAGALTYRVNLYRLLPNGRPSSQKLVQRDIIVTSSVTKGPITVDLTSDQLVLEEDFFLALEWIGGADAPVVSNQLAFFAGAGYTNNELYIRKTSQGTWERQSVGGYLAGMQPRASFFVTVQD